MMTAIKCTFAALGTILVLSISFGALLTRELPSTTLTASSGAHSKSCRDHSLSHRQIQPADYSSLV
jgi:hypothetical protein